jgi:hypothetical protein
VTGSNTASTLVCVTGDFCSGSTLAFTLFRKAGLYHCLYEPLHEDLAEYLIYGLRPDEQSHHFFVDHYYREFRGFSRATELFEREWGYKHLSVSPDEPADALYRYLSYIFGMSYSVAPRVMFKENRMPFRLAWFRSRFPHARVMHIYRDREAQWRSIVRRSQVYQGREDVGQHRVDFNGFSVAAWCEDLKARFPELEASRSATGFERFSRLWELSYEENRRHADVSIDYADLLYDFDATATRMFAGVGVTGIDLAQLRQFVVPPGKQSAATQALRTPLSQIRRLSDRTLRRYAAMRVRMRNRARG